MKKSSNDELRQEIIGLGKNSIRKNYYRSLLEKQKILEERNRELEAEIIKRKGIEDELKILNDDLETRIAERTKDLEVSNERLKASLDELEKSYSYLIESEKIASMTHLVRGISHELSTPLGISLTSVSFAIRLVKGLMDGSNHKMDSKVRKEVSKINQSLDVILKGINRSTNLIKKFKEITSFSEHHKISRFCPNDYLDTLRISMADEISKFKKVDLVIHPDPSLSINGYPRAFMEILTVLLSNTLEHGFTDEGGKIDLYFDEDEDYTYLSYQDDGMGIDDEVIPHLFEPFFTTKMSQKNSGLGLFIVYNLVKNLDGEIKSYNNNGFCVDIKMKKILKRQG